MKTVIPKRSTPSNPYLERVRIVRGDITEQEVDAVISVIPQSLEYLGSLNASLLEAAGERLDKFIIENVYRPLSGDVYAVPGFNLPCKYLFFAILPVWIDDFAREDRQVLGAVRKSIEMATRMNLETLAIPPIACGTNGLPKARAVRLIVQGVSERLTKGIQDVKIVCPDKDMCKLFEERLEIVQK